MYPIDSLPNLTKSLGKYHVDRIRYHQKGTGKRQPAATNLINTVQGHILDFLTPYEHPIENIFYAAVSADDDSKPLSIQRLFNIFQCIPVLNTREIQAMIATDERQARRYMRAAKWALPFLERALLPSESDNDF
jgi:hypothetical protein